MVECARILQAAGDKGVLKTRNLEQIKKIKSAKSKPESKVKAAAAKAVVKKISTTGISVPNFVNGEPADQSRPSTFVLLPLATDTAMYL